MVDGDGPVFRINDPVLPDAGILVLVELQEHILGPGGGGQYLNTQVRRPLKADRGGIVITADDQDIRLHHGIIVHVQADIAGRHVDIARTAVLFGTPVK